MRKIFFGLNAVLLVVLTLAACSQSTRRTFVRENVDLAYVKRVAVLSFENQTTDKYVGERVRNIVITQILALGLFDVADKGLVDSALQEEAIEPGKALDVNSLKRLAQRLQVQAFVMGSVDDSGTGRTGSFAYPELSLTLRLVEANAGVVLWQSSGHRNGDSLMGRLFGLTPSDSFQIADKLVKGLLRSIPSK